MSEYYGELERKLREAQATIAYLEARLHGRTKDEYAPTAVKQSYDPQKDICLLMSLYQQEVKETPELPDPETLLLRARLVFEEALEFVAACGCEVTMKIASPQGEEKTVIVTDDVTVEWDGTLQPDLIEYVDACVDQLVVTYGALNAAGVKVQPVWDEVHRSNMSKVWPDGTIHKREDGKVLKPDTYSPADVRGVLDAGGGLTQ